VRTPDDRRTGARNWSAKAQRDLPKAPFDERMAMGRRARADLYDELADFFDNRIPPATALAEMEAAADGTTRSARPTTPKTAMGRALRRVSLASRTRDFGAAMALFASPIEVQLLSAGQRKPVEALRRAARLLRSVDDVMSQVTAGLAYPFILLNMGLLMLYAFHAHLVPIFTTMIPIERWDGIAGVLAALSGTVYRYLFAGYAVTVAAALFFRYSLPVWTGALRARLDLFFPFSVYRIAQGATFLMSLAALLSARVHLPIALEQLGGPGASPWMRERALAIRAQIKGGDPNLGAAMRDAGFNFPDPDLIRRLVTTSQFGDVDAQLERIAQDWLLKAKKALEGKIAAIGAVTMGVDIGIAVFIALGIMSVSQQFGSLGGAG